MIINIISGSIKLKRNNLNKGTSSSLKAKKIKLKKTAITLRRVSCSSIIILQSHLIKRNYKITETSNKT